MTSKIKYIFPACLLLLFVSMAFVNVAYADSPIWRESSNLYNLEPYISQSDSHTVFIFRSNRDDSILDPGTYTINFVYDGNYQGIYLQYSVDGQIETSGNPNVPFTFEVPEDFETIQLYLYSQGQADLSKLTKIMLNEGSTALPYEPYYSGFRFDFEEIAAQIGQYVQPILTMILPYIFLMIALIIGINAGIRVFRKTAT